jgi:exodeoxyribonuclease V alpha subunit
MIEFLYNAMLQERLAALDYYFAALIDQMEQEAGAEVLLGAALCMQATRQGDVCLGLENLAGAEVLKDEATGGKGVRLPLLPDWLAALRRSNVVGAPGEYKPLILDTANRLYLYRYWDYEQHLAADIAKRADLPGLEFGTDAFGKTLERLFPSKGDGETDWQKVAAATAFLKRLCIISGGPGTGKTYTVVKILALLQELAAPDILHIGLAAPTGKAAGRLAESILQTKKLLDVDAAIGSLIPETASTIHRLLGSMPGSPYFRHDKANPLHLDVLIVDEASMVDLALMCKLLEAFPVHGRPILLGDEDQLASVEAGSVLGDICGGVFENRFSGAIVEQMQRGGIDVLAENLYSDAIIPLEESIVLLERSYRFDAAGGIGLLARSIKNGESERVVGCLQTQASDEIAWHAWQEIDTSIRLEECVTKGYREFLQAGTPQEAFVAFNRFRILCVHRQGSQGVVPVNVWAEALLERTGLLKRKGLWYHGRPVMITRNDYSLHLFNGDVGITLTDEQGGLRVYFGKPDGSVHSVAPARIGGHETAFAMTVHKSQGSEFDHVVLLLPEKSSPLVSRELLYTAVTRARSRFECWGNEAVLKAGVGNLTARQSGLQELLWSRAT